MNRHECEPTLTDTQVLEFCRDGFLMFKGVVPDEINQRVFDYCDKHDGRVPAGEDWYIENVTLNPQAAGAIRSLLGKNFRWSGAGNHRIRCPVQELHLQSNGLWHNDGGSVYTPEIDCLQVFYYPQDTPVELGPTEVVPSSHFLHSYHFWMGHYGRIRSAVSTAAPAGSIFITIYRIWHRRSPSTASGIRNLIKYSYIRTVPPERDWIIEPEFELAHSYHAPPGPQFHREYHRTINDAAEIYFWLCGKHDEYRGTRNNLPIYYS